MQITKKRIVDLSLSLSLIIISCLLLTFFNERPLAILLSVFTILLFFPVLHIIYDYAIKGGFSTSSITLFIFWPGCWLFKRNAIFTMHDRDMSEMKNEIIISAFISLTISLLIVYFVRHKHPGSNEHNMNLKERLTYHIAFFAKDLIIYFILSITIIFFVNLNFSVYDSYDFNMQVIEKTDTINHVYMNANERLYVFSYDGVSNDLPQGNYEIFISEKKALNVGDVKTFRCHRALNGVMYYWIL